MCTNLWSTHQLLFYPDRCHLVICGKLCLKALRWSPSNGILSADQYVAGTWGPPATRIEGICGKAVSWAPLGPPVGPLLDRWVPLPSSANPLGHSFITIQCRGTHVIANWQYPLPEINHIDKSSGVYIKQKIFTVITLMAWIDRQIEGPLIFAHLLINWSQPPLGSDGSYRWWGRPRTGITRQTTPRRTSQHISLDFGSTLGTVEANFYYMRSNDIHIAQRRRLLNR